MTLRTERDPLGEVNVPASAYYGAQTARAVENFPVSGEPMPPAFIHTLGLIKAAAARANAVSGRTPMANWVRATPRPEATARSRCALARPDATAGFEPTQSCSGGL